MEEIKKVIPYRVEESNYDGSIEVPLSASNTEITRLIKEDYEKAKQLFIDGKYVGVE